MCLTSFFLRPSLTLGYFILAPHPSHMLQLEEQRQSLWNNLYCEGKAGPGQLAWLCYHLPARAQGTDVMAQCLPPPPPAGSVYLCPGERHALLRTSGTPLRGSGNPITTHTSASPCSYPSPLWPSSPSPDLCNFSNLGEVSSEMLGRGLPRWPWW